MNTGLTYPQWGQFCEWLLYDRKFSEKKRALSAAKSRFNTLGKHFTDKPLTREEFTAFIASLKEKKNANSTCNKYISMMRLVAKYLKSTDFEDMTYFKTPRKKEVDALSWQEMRAIAELEITYRTSKSGISTKSQNLRYYCLYRLLGETGCRIGEAIELEWVDFQGRQVTFKETKNGDDRTVLVSSELAEYLEHMDKTDKKVFGLKDDWLIRADLKRRAQILKINKQIYPHIFRHSVATNLLSENAPLVYVQELLGHRDVNTTIRYTHNTLAEMENMLYTYSGWWKQSQTFTMLSKRVRSLVARMVESPCSLEVVQNEEKLVITIRNALRPKENPQLVGDSSDTAIP